VTEDHPNAALTRRVFGAFGRDAMQISAALCRDIVWRVPGDTVMSGEYRGRRLLVDLEAHAQRLGYRGIVLETGTRNHEALALYASFGYEPIPCYGVYAQQATSRCFEKTFRTPETG
jgi:GNAT superfamily N-acetyltransferase